MTAGDDAFWRKMMQSYESGMVRIRCSSSAFEFQSKSNGYLYSHASVCSTGGFAAVLALIERITWHDAHSLVADEQAAAPVAVPKKRKGPVANGRIDAAANGVLQVCAAAPALVAVSSDSVAVVGWEEGPAGVAAQSSQLRVVVLDTLYGTVQSVQSFAAGDSTSGSAGSGKAEGSSGGAAVALRAAVVDWDAGELALLLDSTVMQLFVEVCRAPSPPSLELHKNNGMTPDR